MDSLTSHNTYPIDIFAYTKLERILVHSLLFSTKTDELPL